MHINFVGKSEGKKPLGRPRLRWEDNFRMALKEIGWEVLDISASVAGFCEHDNEPSGYIKGEEFLD
jgi:hypothetical protein